MGRARWPSNLGLFTQSFLFCGCLLMFAPADEVCKAGVPNPWAMNRYLSVTC